MEQAQLSRLLSFNLLVQQSVAQQEAISITEFGHAVIRAVLGVLNADAVAFLVHDKQKLMPVAVHGLLPECLGRRFVVAEHPRLAAIANSKKATTFLDSPDLPDPYDGLLLASHGNVPVHACMGVPLWFQDTLLGVLTFDSLNPRAFDEYPLSMLNLLQQSVSASFWTVLKQLQLAESAKHQSALVHALSAASHDIVGTHPLMQKLKSEIQLVASSDLSVLIMGETGTGKELVARHIHHDSKRRDGPYVQVNCASLPEGLAESEFFGHRKGAFTGADKARDGKFLLADGGTLFLDEIGELPLTLQSKLLRVLQSGEIQPVGADETKQVNVRIVAATNRDLQKEVAEGRFRADLYHRLSVYPIHVPALRQRLSDVVQLSGFFIEQLRKKLHVEQLVLSSKLLTVFEQYDWPGNVRELEHILSRAALKAKHELWPQKIIKIEPTHCELSSQSGSLIKVEPAITVSNLKEATERYQNALIVQALEQTQFNWAEAARQLGVDRANLVRLAKRLGISIKKSIN